MKKIYTIRVMHTYGRPKIWYSDHLGKTFEAELKARPGANDAVFYVTMSQYVYPVDCIVLSERLEEIYKG